MERRYYEPPKTDRLVWACEGLTEVVRRANNEGLYVTVSFEHDWDEDEEIVTPETVVSAVNEVDVALLHFYDSEDKYKGSLSVIPSNDEDWAADWHVSLSPIIEPALGLEDL